MTTNTKVDLLHLRDRTGKPPTASFRRLVAALLPNEPIQASQTVMDYSDGQTTLWTTWLATATMVTYASARFNGALVTGDDDFGQTSGGQMTIIEAFTRPLSTIAAFNVRAVGKPSDDRNWFPIEEATLQFNDGHAVNMPSQELLTDPDQRDRSDQLFHVVRGAA